MPRKKKSPGEAVDPRNGTPVLRVYTGDAGKRERPPAPKNIRADARRVWVAYWDDVVSGVVRESEFALVRRWIANYNRYLILLDTADAQPFTHGSTGQLVAHPAYALAMKLEISLRYDEQQLGWGPKNRADLGISLVEGTRSLAELNAQYGGADGRAHTGGRVDAADDEEDDDPRRTTG